jgi:hypothetical protein
VHDVSQGNSRDTGLPALGLGDFIEDFSDSFIGYAAVGRSHKGLTAAFVAVLEFLELFFGLEAATTEGSPGGKSETEGASHGDDLTFKVTFSGTPATLVDREWAKAVVFGVLIELRYDPCRCVGDGEIQDFSLFYEIVERVSQFLDRSCIIPWTLLLRSDKGYIPPMNVQDVDIVGPQFFQTVVDRDSKALGGVSSVIDVNGILLPAALIGRGELGSENNLTSIASLFHPFSNPRFALPTLITIGGLNMRFRGLIWGDTSMKLPPLS